MFCFVRWSGCRKPVPPANIRHLTSAQITCFLPQLCPKCSLGMPAKRPRAKVRGAVITAAVIGSGTIGPIRSYAPPRDRHNERGTQRCPGRAGCPAYLRSRLPHNGSRHSPDGGQRTRAAADPSSGLSVRGTVRSCSSCAAVAGVLDRLEVAELDYDEKRARRRAAVNSSPALSTQPALPPSPARHRAPGMGPQTCTALKLCGNRPRSARTASRASSREAKAAPLRYRV